MSRFYDKFEAREDRRKSVALKAAEFVSQAELRSKVNFAKSVFDGSIGQDSIGY